ncbi:hypothetical protein C9374_004468 [Naegleria lovaniensis]|uniref:Sphingolipid delta4-desaturase N-terminal domain-containing protein n=1 Tax=Naegleria lovaniensis TaxID=51637 RepID=A0AA88GLE0_NAELO|nr:uncharacterized protein C9374_004468 [Naegleria lovaniensis]KAG2383131.1 hypothetical protein C9374_004468 [Naegleria lovaniensis]
MTAATLNNTSKNNSKEYDGVDPSVLNLKDFLWSKQDEPHWKRKKEILKRYPQIKELYGIDPATKYKITALVLIQFLSCYLLVTYRPAWYVWLAVMWIIGGTCNTSLTVGIHELTHGLGFEKFEYNLYMAIFGNLPLGVPYTMSFKRYHHDHHMYQGVVGVDTDISTRIEALLIQSKWTKFIHVFFMVFFYSLRPIFVAPKKLTFYEWVNNVIVIAFMAAIYYLSGTWLAPFYFLGSSFLGLGPHPLSGHFISEHYVTKPGQETYSYYGPGNWLMFNVGYHNEHHDFPKIPCCNLPKVRQVAPEFYNNLKTIDSWAYVLWEYITTDGYTPFNRVTRTMETHRSARQEDNKKDN